MKKIIFFYLTLVLFVSGETNSINFEKSSWFDSVSTTKTNVVFKLNDTRKIFVSIDGNSRRSELGEIIYLNPNQKIIFSDGRHVMREYNPVVFKSKKEGFQIHRITLEPRHGFETNTTYIVLSDKPVHATENDVKSVMINGKWKTIAKYKISKHFLWFLVLPIGFFIGVFAKKRLC